MTADPLQQAMQLHQAGRLAEAVYARLLTQTPFQYPLLHLFGLLRLQQGRVAEALALMERALQAQPGVPETLTNYAIALDAAGRTAEALGRIDEALAVYDRVLEMAPRQPLALQSRDTAPLFDTARTTRAIEAAYQGMFDRWQRGEAPEAFAVTE